MSRISRTLLHQLGVERLRPGQGEVIENVLAGEDTLAILPTGAGKSLCYQLPALQLDGTTIVITPLISLMKDQADKLEDHGVEAAALNSTLSEGDEKEALRDVRKGLAEIVFTTPERLADPSFLDTLRRAKVDFVVVDEAHCISQWGHDFRPAFLGIADALEALGNPPVLALTATATEAVAADIAKQLRRPAMRVIRSGIFRPNLRFSVRQVTNEDEKFAMLLDFVRSSRGTGIVYAATVKAAEAIHARLVKADENALLYHGRLPAKERHAQQEAFMGGAGRVMVATSAFGLGIDKPDIRFVVHYQMPGSLEAYYQEAGRAGRDGAEARCVLLYDHADRRVQLFFAGGRDKRKSQADREKVERMTFYAQSALCRWEMLLEYFGEPGQRCGECDNCLHPVKTEGREMHIEIAAPKLQPGDAVEVPRYGRGVVEAHGADRITVSFPEGITRDFAPAFVARAG